MTCKGVLIKSDAQTFSDCHGPDAPVRARRIQLPLKLAYALTIHKSQGLSIDLLDIDLRGAFTHGQAYVALSRATSFETLRVRFFTEDSIITSPAVKTFYERLGKKRKREDI